MSKPIGRRNPTVCCFYPSVLPITHRCCILPVSPGLVSIALLPIAYFHCLLPVSPGLVSIACCQLPTFYWLLLVAPGLVSIACCQLPTFYCLLLVAPSLVSIACCQLPIFLLPTAWWVICWFYLLFIAYIELCLLATAYYCLCQLPAILSWLSIAMSTASTVKNFSCSCCTVYSLCHGMKIGKKTILYRAGIFKHSRGAKNWVGIGLSYRPARLHRLAEWFLGIDSWAP